MVIYGLKGFNVLWHHLGIQKYTLLQNTWKTESDTKKILKFFSSKVSSLALQKEHHSDSTFLSSKNILFIKRILFSILFWETPNYVSTSSYIDFQSKLMLVKYPSYYNWKVGFLYFSKFVYIILYSLTSSSSISCFFNSMMIKNRKVCWNPLTIQNAIFP